MIATGVTGLVGLGAELKLRDAALWARFSGSDLVQLASLRGVGVDDFALEQPTLIAVSSLTRRLASYVLRVLAAGGTAWLPPGFG
eukprot:6456157-Amphidinium_carterae.1